MAKIDSPLYRMCGLNLNGDLGPVTFYRNHRGKTVFFLSQGLAKAPTVPQLHQRNKFRLAARAWNDLTQLERTRWEDASKRLHLKCTGYNFFVWWAIVRDRDRLTTFEKKYGHHLEDPWLDPI